MPKAGETYEYIGNEDSEFGDVKFQVTSVGTEIKYTYVFENTKSAGTNNGDVQMIEIDFGTETWYVTNILGGEFKYKPPRRQTSISTSRSSDTSRASIPRQCPEPSNSSPFFREMMSN